MNTYFNQNPIPGTGPYVVSGFSENSYVEFGAVKLRVEQSVYSVCFLMV
jgi:hypothetical protein